MKRIKKIMQHSFSNQFLQNINLAQASGQRFHASGQASPFNILLSGDRDSVFPGKKPALPNIKPALPNKKPVFPDIKPVLPNKKPVLPDIKPVLPNKKPALPDIKPVFSGKKQALFLRIYGLARLFSPKKIQYLIIQ